MSQELTGWTVYHWPSDRPEEWLARKWTASASRIQAHDETLTAPTLAELREKLPPGLFNLGRHTHDDPVIHEVWI